MARPSRRQQLPEVAVVARHGKAVVPFLIGPAVRRSNYSERDRKRWKVQQQVALSL